MSQPAQTGRSLWLLVRAGSIKRRLLVLLVVVVAFVVLAPTIALRSPLRSILLARLVPAEVGTVSVEQIRAGWLTPISATKVVVLDPEGKPLVEVERLTIDRSLSGLVANSHNLGIIRLECPTLHTEVRDDGSNIEDAIAGAVKAFGDSSDDPSKGGIHYRLEVVDGRVLSRHVSKTETWGVNAIHATLVHASTGQLHLELKGEAPSPATLQGTTPESGRFELASTEVQPGTRNFRFACHQLPLAVFSPWLPRLDPSLQLAGLATGECQFAMSATQVPPVIWTDVLTGNTSGKLSTTGMRVAAASLGNEAIVVSQADLAWKGSADRGNLTLENLSLASDYVMLDLRGTMPATALATAGTNQMSLAHLFSAGDLDAEGRLNVARMSQLMPKLMQIRPDTTLTQGEVRFTGRSEPHNGGQRLLASVTTTPLAGVNGGRPFSWDAPLAIDVTAHRYAQNLRLDQIQCNSEFLHVTATGDRRQMNVEGSFDLDQLTKRLNQFVDLNDWKLAGNGQLKATWQTDQQGRLTAGGSGSLNQLVAVYQGDQLAMEPELKWQATLLGNTDNQSLWPVRLRSGQVSLDATGDNLLVDLIEAVDLASVWSSTEWPLQIRTTGKLASWTRRLRPWLNLASYQLNGDLALNAKARVRLDPLRISVTDSTIGIDALSAQAASWKLNEARVEWTGDMGWDQQTGTLSSREGRLVSSTMAATLRDWFWTADMKQAQQVGGLAAIRVNLQRMAALRNVEAQVPGAMEPSGELVGNVKLASHAGQVMAMVDLTANQLALTKFTPGLPGQGAIPQVFWQEPSLNLKGTVAYHPAQDRMTFDGLRIESQALAAAVGGAIEKLSATRDLTLAGTIDYDLARLTPILAQYVGEGIALTGREQARFEVAGSLAQGAAPLVQAVSTMGTPTSGHWSTRWKGRVLAPWQSMTLYGLPVGPGRIAAQMDQSQVAIEPLAFTVAEGQFSASPQVVLDPTPGEISLPAGPLLTSIQLTPKVTDEMLKYFVPYLSGATQTNGQFSVRLDSARVPLGNPRGITAAGQLTLHSVKVRPGAEISRVLNVGLNLEKMLKQPGIASLLGGTSAQPVAQLSITDRRIDFWVEQGRVYHQGVEFGSEDFIFRSRGSVGFDQTVSVMIEIPVLDKWVKSGHPLRGKSLQLPVSGSLSKLELEEGALLRELARVGLGGQDGAGVIGNELNNALEKLLGGGKRE